MENERQTIIIENGFYYGYPICCVDEFCIRADEWFIHGRVLPIDQQFNQGFIPCSYHRSMINKNEIRIEDLISHRQCVTYFPIT